jgi:hypothetical protein
MSDFAFSIPYFGPKGTKCRMFPPDYGGPPIRLANISLLLHLGDGEKYNISHSLVPLFFFLVVLDKTRV